MRCVPPLGPAVLHDMSSEHPSQRRIRTHALGVVAAFVPRDDLTVRGVEREGKLVSFTLFSRLTQYMLRRVSDFTLVVA